MLSVDKKDHPRVSHNSKELGKSSHKGAFDIASPCCADRCRGGVGRGSGHGAAGDQLAVGLGVGLHSGRKGKV